MPNEKLTCPECGGHLDLDVNAQAETTVHVAPPAAMPYLEKRLRPAIVAFCTECEFALEIIVTH